MYDMKRLQCSIHEPDGREIYSASARSKYCDLLVEAPGGYARCLQCDRAAITAALTAKEPFQYRCHAGAIDSAIPVIVGGETNLVILFGQILDDSPLEEQWEQAQKLVSWYPDQERLRQAFYQLPRFSQREIKACYELVNACVSETRLEQLTAPASDHMAQKLEYYIDTHYTEAISVTDVARALGMSVSRTCALAARISPGMTINKLLTKRRVAAAMASLCDPQVTIREAASRAGIPDYNYFTKVFKKVTGQTPSNWRSSQETTGSS